MISCLVRYCSLSMKRKHLPRPQYWTINDVSVPEALRRKSQVQREWGKFQGIGEVPHRNFPSAMFGSILCPLSLHTMLQQHTAGIQTSLSCTIRERWRGDLFGEI